MKYKRVTFSLTEEDHLFLTEIAKKIKESMSSQVRRLIRLEYEKQIKGERWEVKCQNDCIQKNQN
jgi:ribosome recycling factor